MVRVSRNVWETFLVPSSFNTTSELSLMVEFCTSFMRSSAFLDIWWTIIRECPIVDWPIQVRTTTRSKLPTLKFSLTCRGWKYRRAIISTYCWSLCRLDCFHQRTPFLPLFLLLLSLFLLLLLPFLRCFCLDWLEWRVTFPLLPEVPFFPDQELLPLFYEICTLRRSSKFSIRRGCTWGSMGGYLHCRCADKRL